MGKKSSQTSREVFRKVFKQRCDRKILLKDLDACLITDPFDLFYLTGMDVSLGALVLRKDKGALFVDGRYLAIAQKTSPVPVSDEKLKTYLKGAKRIGFDSCYTSYDGYLRLKKEVSGLVPVPGPLKTIRVIKDKDEIAKMRIAALLSWKGFLHLQKKIKAGMTELELAFEYESFCRKEGASGMAFDPIIAFGENTAFPHHKSGHRKLKQGDAILCDVGVILNHYRSDMTRMLYFGKPNREILRLEEVVRGAQAAALKLCRPGVKLKDLDIAARDVMKKAKLESLYTHSLGHGIGLETHEFPRIRSVGEDADVRLEAGMVITIEPGLYKPGVGGVRLEDTIAITERGHTNFYV
jgi:Xaa-Pro aminopeptidase